MLGGVIGDQSGIVSFVSDKVSSWIKNVELLSEIGISQPQAAYCAFTRSLQSEWTFLQRVVLDCSQLFIGLQDVISNVFIPYITGFGVMPVDRLLFSLPVRMGGLNINNPSETYLRSYHTSREATGYLVDCIKGLECYESESHHDVVKQTRLANRTKNCDVFENLYNKVLSEVSPNCKRSITRTRDCLSSWLNVMPIAKDNFDLSAVEFRDGLCLRYRKPMLQLPPNCDGCGAMFSINHALDCRRGGLVVQ